VAIFMHKTGKQIDACIQINLPVVGIRRPGEMDCSIGRAGVKDKTSAPAVRP
jgi:hypothetical protein